MSITENPNEIAPAQLEALIFDTLFVHVPVGLVLFDCALRYVRINSVLAAINGVPVEAHTGKTVAEVLPHLAPTLEPMLRRVLETGEAASMEITDTKPDSPEERQGFLRYCPLRDPQGAIWGILGIVVETTQVRQAEAALSESEERFHNVADSLGEGVLITDPEDIVLYANGRVEEITGFAVSEMVGQPSYALLLPPEQWEELRQRNRERLQGISGYYEQTLLCKSGGSVWVAIHASPYRNKAGRITGTLAAIADISERKRAEATILRQAFHDALTGLPNRALFLDRAERALVAAGRHSHSAAVLFLDLDNFKHVNDSLGHAAGDRLLQQVAAPIQEHLRDEDTLARLGGDEFAILLPTLEDYADAAQVARRILEAVTRPVVIEGRELLVTGSMGISVFPQHGKDPAELLQSADTAMYRAKAQGRNVFQYFTEEMNVAASERLILENDLRRALERGELSLHYQPQARLSNRRIIGMEALLRWNHPLLGNIPPNKFIPLAEETGLIVPIGEWALRAACVQAAQWRAAGHDLQIAVNLSARQFSQPGLVETVQQVLAETGMDPQCLDLELTETALVEIAPMASQTITALQEMGMRLSVDDFGTGYSSLAYLSHLPLDILKIDKQFVADVAASPKAQALVRALVELSRALNLVVIAEGVETEAQCEHLQSLGCDLMQGYLFSPPLPAEELEALLASEIIQSPP